MLQTATKRQPHPMLRFIYPLLFVGILYLQSCSPEQLDRSIESGEAAGSIASSAKPSKGEQEPEKISVERVAKPKWKLLKRFEGKSNKKTSTFKVNAEEWKISWRVQSRGKDDGEFIIILHNKKDKNDSEIVAQQVGSGEDFADFTGGAGEEYYLDVTSKQPFEIWIEEYK
jgi:hypothetical protein